MSERSMKKAKKINVLNLKSRKQMENYLPQTVKPLQKYHMEPKSIGNKLQKGLNPIRHN